MSRCIFCANDEVDGETPGGLKVVPIPPRPGTVRGLRLSRHARQIGLGARRINVTQDVVAALPLKCLDDTVAPVQCRAIQGGIDPRQQTFTGLAGTIACHPQTGRLRLLQT